MDEFLSKRHLSMLHEEGVNKMHISLMHDKIEVQFNISPREKPRGDVQNLWQTLAQV